MATALDIITDALCGIGVYAPGEVISAADAALCLGRLNDMADQWSNESLMSYANTENSTVLVPGKYQYTIGNGGDINVTRPLRILDSPGSCYIVDSNGNRYDLVVVPQARWNVIGNIAQVTANFPNTLFYDPQYPLGIINIYPIPNVGWTLYFDSRIQIAELSSLTAPISLPPGYKAALQDNLSCELWRFFKPDNVPIPPTTLGIAARSKGNIKRTNIKENIANYDPELVSRANGTFNIYTYSNRSGSS